MNHNELKLARKLLNLSESESATYLGEGMNARTWEFYERNHISNYGVKPYIAEKLRSLLRYRKAIIDNALSAMEDGEFVIIYYNEAEHFEDFLSYKVYSSAVTTLNVDYGFNLIVFDSDDYQDFLTENNLEDSQQHKVRWATKKYNEIQAIKKELLNIEATLAEKKEVLMAYCDKVGFTRPEAFKFINLLTTVSQKSEDKQEERFNEFLAKMLPHSLFYAENATLKADFVQMIKVYLNKLKEWAISYHKTKGLIEGV